VNNPQPPVRPLADLLPFGQLEWPQFEEAVRDLVRRDPAFRNVEFYGGPGDHQDGIDIRADRDNKHVGIQVKRNQDFGAGDVDDAVRAATYKADEFIIALSRRATVGARKEIDKHQSWAFLDQVDLSDRVRDLPPAQAAEYVERHFHQGWVDAFLGRGRPTAFIDRATYFAPFLDPALFIYHGWTRVGAPTWIDQLRAFLGNPDQRLAIVSGPIGIGKTKLMFDLTADAAALADRAVYLAAPGATITVEGLREIRAGAALVIADDADAIEACAALLAHVARRPDAKLIVVTQATAASRLRDEALIAGFDPNQLQGIVLEQLRRDATIALTREVLGREDPLVEGAIVRYASDSPLTTILMTRLIRDRTTTADALESHAQVRDVVLARYRDIATGNVSAAIPREDVKAVLQVLAALGPAPIERDDWLVPAAAFLGWEIDRLLRVLDALDDAGAIRRIGFHYSVVPEMLRQSILIEASVARGRATTFPQRLLEHFPLDGRLLCNVAGADLELRTTNGPAIFTPLWERVLATIARSHSADRVAFLKELGDLALYKPAEVFELVRYLIERPATNDDTQPYADIPMATRDQNDVLEHLAPVLKDVMLGSPAHIPASVRILWHLGRNQDNRLRADPIRTIRDLAEYRLDRGSDVAEAIVDAVAALIGDGEPDTKQHSLLDVIVPILSRDIHAMIDRGPRLEVRRLVVAVERVQRLRDRAIAVFVEAARDPDGRRADKAIQQLVNLLREPEHQIAEPSAESVAAWNRERAMVFNIYQTIIDVRAWPLRELRIGNVLPWYARNSPSPFVREGATYVLATLAPTPDRDRVLIDEFMCDDAFVDLHSIEAFAEGARLSQEFAAAVARQLIDELDEPEPILEDIGARLDRIAEAGIAGNPLRLFDFILELEPLLGARLGQTIVERADPRFYRWLGPFVRSALQTDLAAGAVFARTILDTDNVDAALGVVQGLVYKRPADDADAEVRAALLRRTLDHIAPSVRVAAAGVAYFFTRDWPRWTVPLILETHIGTDDKLADRLFMMLPHNGPDADVATLRELAHKLVGLPELTTWPLQYLTSIATNHSAIVLELFEQRLRVPVDDDRFHPVPYSDVPFGDVVTALVRSPNFRTEARALLARSVDLPAERRLHCDILFGHFAKADPTFAKEATLDALGSGDDKRQRAATAWLRFVPHDMLTNDLPYLVRVLEEAYAISEAVGSAAAGSIHNALISGAESVALYEPAPSEMRLQAVGTAALVLGNLSPPVSRFFESLRTLGRELGVDTVRRAEEAFGPE
jgi:hypothetical protein